ncbi:hypothetical protein TSAR_003127 [Trichomalopsis sarcophagae]|uniref:CHHC U11-48K-type domain-containing protein n=1 Tax=Trichomalopsis sarcophagae TaxID=543379 RepID=A0A232F7R4_9HYME|nr:hypothetical protein TSAR_003127 [Trichomalopsis sarcophagae]
MSFNVRLEVDPVIICPYDSNHRIARSRIQRHLVKCEKNYPPDYKQQCPYDASHRVFEHEMIEHVTNCPMKLSNPIDAAAGSSIMRLPETDTELESQMESDEVWDEGPEAATRTNPYNEPISFETVNLKQYATISAPRGNAMIAKKFHSKLRRPFGYSESMLLDMSTTTSCQEADDDTESVTSEMGVGRGQTFFQPYRGQYARGRAGRSYGRGFRGRLLH